jgi:hypothetical protein
VAGGGGGGVLHPSNPKAAAFCARHVEALLSRVVIPPATKGCAPGAPRACHVVDHMSRVVSDPRQKGGPFVAPSLSRLAARDKRPLRSATKGLFSTSVNVGCMPRRTLKKYGETICTLLTLVVEFCFDYVRRDWLINIKLLRERENTKVCITKYK